MTKLYDRMTTVCTGMFALALLTWLIWLIDREAWPGIFLPITLTAVGVANIVVTVTRPTWKVQTVRKVQRWAINPIVRGCARLGLNPLGITLLETTDRRPGQPRVVPVGVAVRGQEAWLVAEHGLLAGYVRNIAHDSTVRILVRRGLRRQWVTAVAQIQPEDDPLARQRTMAGVNPLRWANVMMVRVLGTDLLSIRLKLK